MFKLFIGVFLLPMFAMAHTSLEITKQLSRNVSKDFVCGEGEQIASDLQRYNLGNISFTCDESETGEGYFDGWHRQYATIILHIENENLCRHGMPLFAKVNATDLSVQSRRTIENDDHTLIELAPCSINQEATSIDNILAPYIISQESSRYVLQGDPNQDVHPQVFQILMREIFGLQSIEMRGQFTETTNINADETLYSLPSDGASSRLFALIKSGNSLITQLDENVRSNTISVHDDSLMIEVSKIDVPDDLIVFPTIEQRNCRESSPHISYRLNARGELAILDGREEALSIFNNENAINRFLFSQEPRYRPSLSLQNACLQEVNVNEEWDSTLDSLVKINRLRNFWVNRQESVYGFPVWEANNLLYRFTPFMDIIFSRLNDESLFEESVEIIKKIVTGMINRPNGDEYKTAILRALDLVKEANSLPNYRIRNITAEERYEGSNDWTGFVYRRRMAGHLSKLQIEKIEKAVRAIVSE